MLESVAVQMSGQHGTTSTCVLSTKMATFSPSFKKINREMETDWREARSERQGLKRGRRALRPWRRESDYEGPQVRRQTACHPHSLLFPIDM